MTAENIQIQCEDGVKLAAKVYEPKKQAKGAVAICSALGVPQKFYSPFSSFLSENGYIVVTFDYRGIGESKNGTPKGRNIKMQDWGIFDIDAVLNNIFMRDAGQVFLIGHSAGGQLVGLSPNSEHLSGIVMAPSSSANWRLYPKPYSYILYLVWHFLIPVISFGRDQFPAKMLGLSSMDVPRGVMQQWANWARKPNYFFSKGFEIDTHRYAELDLPILAYGFDDDVYASEKAIDHLLSQYSKAKIEKHYLNTRELGKGKVGHFGFFKEKMKDPLWIKTLEWIENL